MNNKKGCKIGMCGTVSCGKTTLVNELKKLPQFSNYKFVTERSKYLRDLGILLNIDSTINGQIVFAAERASELLVENIITDRTIIDVQAFTMLAESITEEQKKDFIKLTSHLIEQYDYIFYLSPDEVPIEDNGVRTIDPEYRELIDINIRQIIGQNMDKIQNFLHISGTIDERVKMVLHFLEI